MKYHTIASRAESIEDKTKCIIFTSDISDFLKEIGIGLPDWKTVEMLSSNWKSWLGQTGLRDLIQGGQSLILFQLSHEG